MNTPLVQYASETLGLPEAVIQKWLESTHQRIRTEATSRDLKSKFGIDSRQSDGTPKPIESIIKELTDLFRNMEAKADKCELITLAAGSLGAARLNALLAALANAAPSDH